MEARLSRVLRAGTIAAGTLIALGLALFLARHPREPILPHAHAPAMAHPVELVDAALSLDGLAIVGVGVVCLILTPTLRVVFVLLSFLARRDWLFAALSLVVLGVLLAGWWTPLE